MLRVGLSGGIGSGKSTVAHRLAEHGAVVVDADRVARQVVERGTDGLAQVRARFGDAVLATDGSLDRPALGRMVFGDQAARRDLEAILHPLIARRSAELFAAAPREAVVVHDIPLLVELDRSADYHLTVIVGASEQIRHQRLVRDRGMTDADAWSRIRAQADDAKRRAAADLWITNEDTRGRLLAEVDAAWDSRISPFNQNLLTGSRSRAARAVVVDYDPAWPAQAARLIARIRRVLGDRAVDVQHIGSTSVPGLAAKDVIDLQVGVRSLADADDPGFVGALSAQGFPRVEGNTRDRPKPHSSDPAQWRKRFHGSADPGRVAHVYVRRVGSAGYRYALDFRDWLRADSAERDRYGQEKRRLAAGHPTAADYADAKESWFDAALPRLDTWRAAR